LKEEFKSISKAISNHQKANIFILEIIETLNKNIKEIELKTQDKWNLLFFLQHEIVSLVSLKISSYYGYKLRNYDSYNYKELINIKTNPLILNRNFLFEDNLLLEIIVKFITKIFSFKIIHPSRKPTFYVKNKSYQMKKLTALIRDINSKFSHLNKKYISIEEIIKNLEIRELKNFSLIQFPLIFFAGTRANLDIRYIASLTLKKKGFVIATTHGRANNFILDEPVIDYSEFTNCSLLYNYGAKDAFKNKIQIDDSIKIMYRDDKKLKRNIKKVNIKNINKIKYEQKIIYTPTILSGNGMYFPYRQLPDDIYIQHFRFILNNYPNCYICIHPKNRSSNSNKELRSFLKDFQERIIKQKFSYLLRNDKYKLFLIDYISTTSTELLAYRKKIIYVDLGLNNLRKEYSDSLKKEVIKVELRDLYQNTKSIRKLIKKIINDTSSHELKKIRHTDKFSFNS